MKISLTYPSEQKIKPKKCKGGDSKSEIKNVSHDQIFSPTKLD